MCLLISNLQQKREVVRSHSEDEEMESPEEEEEESFGEYINSYDSDSVRKRKRRGR
jgi:hypothetical protein